MLDQKDNDSRGQVGNQIARNALVKLWDCRILEACEDVNKQRGEKNVSGQEK